MAQLVLILDVNVLRLHREGLAPKVLQQPDRLHHFFVPLDGAPITSQAIVGVALEAPLVLTGQERDARASIHKILRLLDELQELNLTLVVAIDVPDVETSTIGVGWRANARKYFIKRSPHARHEAAAAAPRP